MKTLLTVIVFALASVAFTQPVYAETLTETLMRNNCKTLRNKSKSQIEKFNCTQQKSDSVQMKDLHTTGIVLTNLDEFEKFEQESTDLSHVNNVETEIVE